MNVVGNWGNSTLFVKDGFHISKHLKEKNMWVYFDFSGHNNIDPISNIEFLAKMNIFFIYIAEIWGWADTLQ